MKLTKKIVAAIMSVMDMYNNYGYGWKKCVSSHSATETGGSVISKTGWTVNGYYVY